MPVPANKQVNSITETKVTSISTNARIEYIMRFSKHAVLVIDDSSDVYSAVGSHFLGTLPSNHNAAFIAVSPKLNEIQIRCRLIEQLFVDTLFDPEEALAVTVLKLSKGSKEVISIVVENVQFLSLQLMHEFCQLAELAAKAGRCVNVLLLGEEKTRQLISDNKVVFKEKLSIVSAEDGQLICIDTLVSNKNHSKLLTPFRKGMIAVTFLSSATILSLIFLYQAESPTFTEFDSLGEKDSLRLDALKVESSSFIKVMEISAPQARASEIYQNLVAHKDTKTASELIEIAQPNEVANILITKPIITRQINTEKISAKGVKAGQLAVVEELKADTFDSTIILDSPSVTEHNKVILSEEYFQKIKQGYVAQIIGFSKLETYRAFMEKYNQQNFVSYSRVLNSARVFIITTRVYPLKSDVQAVISMLPIELQKNKPWVKPIEAIKNEMNEYLHSQ
ncbi:MAG: hypothetical protein MJK12_03315 [Colwellia sp.]|nr:hypothetical protein [Colwellia sp.]